MSHKNCFQRVPFGQVLPLELAKHTPLISFQSWAFCINASLEITYENYILNGKCPSQKSLSREGDISAKQPSKYTYKNYIFSDKNDPWNHLPEGNI